MIHWCSHQLYIVSAIYLYSLNMAKMRPYLLDFFDQWHIGHIFDAFWLGYLFCLNTFNRQAREE